MHTTTANILDAALDAATDQQLTNLVRDLGRLDGMLAEEVRKALRTELAHRVRG